jgi:hypothetical protein
LVYKPFLGSGTTLAAAELTERVCLGAECRGKVAPDRAFGGIWSYFAGTGTFHFAPTHFERSLEASDLL